jgi:hypothetical protein
MVDVVQTALSSQSVSCKRTWKDQRMSDLPETDIPSRSAFDPIYGGLQFHRIAQFLPTLACAGMPGFQRHGAIQKTRDPT